jgi:uncharacterized Zn-binding protein involved in type VI secretion
LHKPARALRRGSSQSGRGAARQQLRRRHARAADHLRCDQTGHLQGHVTSGAELTLELDPPFVPGGCTAREGGKTATGTVLPDGSMVIGLTERGHCALVWGAGLSSPTDDLDFNIRFTMKRR